MTRLESRLGRSFSKLVREEGIGRERPVILLNGHNIGPDFDSSLKLDDGDEVAIFPPVAGG
jgi:molybdopterin converting factor small subunit